MNELRRFFRSIIHPLLAVVVPWLFLTLIVCLSLSLVDGVGVPWPLLLYLLLVCIEQAGLANALETERSGSFARLREILIILILTVVVMGLAPVDRQGPLYSIQVGFVFLLALFGWFLGFLLQRNFRAREQLLDVVGNKQGSVLKKAMRDNGYLGSVASEGLRSNRLLLFFLLGLGSCLFLLVIIIGNSSDLAPVLLYLVYAGVSVVGIGVVNMFLRDLYIMGAGVRIPDSLQRRRVLSQVLWSILLVAFVLFLASDKALLKLPEFDNYRVIQESEALPSSPLPPPQQTFLPPPPLPEPVESDFNLGWLAKLVQNILIAVLVLSVIVFLLFPLISGDALSFFNKYNPFRIAWNLCGRFIRYCVFLWQLWGRGGSARLAEDVFSNSDAATGSRALATGGVLKQLERNRIISLYLRIMLWGRSRGYPREKHAPLEYCKDLASRFPALSDDLMQVARIFEKAMFSPQLLEHQQLSDYKMAVKRVLRDRG